MRSRMLIHSLVYLAWTVHALYLHTHTHILHTHTHIPWSWKEPLESLTLRYNLSLWRTETTSTDRQQQTKKSAQVHVGMWVHKYSRRAVSRIYTRGGGGRSMHILKSVWLPNATSSIIDKKTTDKHRLSFNQMCTISQLSVCRRIYRDLDSTYKRLGYMVERKKKEKWWDHLSSCQEEAGKCRKLKVHL